VVLEALYAFWKPAEFPACPGKTGKFEGERKKGCRWQLLFSPPVNPVATGMKTSINTSRLLYQTAVPAFTGEADWCRNAVKGTGVTE